MTRKDILSASLNILGGLAVSTSAMYLLDFLLFDTPKPKGVPGLMFAWIGLTITGFSIFAGMFFVGTSFVKLISIAMGYDDD